MDHDLLRQRDANYVAAVDGRRTFRQMYRDQKAIAAIYGLALMMIREGCADPRKVAADALSKATRGTENG